MSFYPPKTQPDWVCPECDTRNPAHYTICYRCFTIRPSVAAESATLCSCAEFPGDDLRCPVHGVVEEKKQ
jgi:hypothetical protein